MRTRIATGLAVGAASLALALGSSPASASDWTVVGGFPTQSACNTEGQDYIENNSDLHDYTEYKCEYSGSSDMWLVHVR
ncbi:hypothetical protein DSY14_21950 [Nocardiopsis sp. MG754419]|nr:hypothetical protein [Nocardiopsis sp. MG754419]